MKTRLRSIIERVLTYTLIAAAIVGLLYFFGSVNHTQKDTIEKKKIELNSLNAQQLEAEKNLQERVEKVNSIAAQLKVKRQEVREKFERLLEKSSNYTVFIEQVQRKAKSLDVHIQNSTYTAPAPIAGAGGNYLEFKFEIRISGQYNKIKQFLWEIENTLGRLVKISSINIIPPMTTPEGIMSMNLTLSTYFLP